MQLPKCLDESVQLGAVDTRFAAVAARRLAMVGRRILNFEQVVQHLPDVAVSLARLPLPYVEDDHRRPPFWVVRWLHRERNSKAAPQVQAADDRRERSAQPVGAQARVARIGSKAAPGFCVTRTLAGEGIDLALHGAGHNDRERLSDDVRR